jgi:putative PIN family toxin of toxin-antitoxin system
VRIVLDTNVVLSALLWRGTPHQLLGALATRPTARLFSSPRLLEELSNVLSRPAASRQLSLIGKAARNVLADYLEIVEVVEPVEVPRVARDPDDDHVLACGLSARADLIVSGDRDLLDLAIYQSIQIVSPADAALRLTVPK